jgi:hypothetical protein
VEATLNLKQFQDRFQRAILEHDDAILEDIPDGPRETKRNLLGIYRDAYVLRLIDVVASDHDLLRLYQGEDQFRAMARAYVAAFPSRHRNARWFAHNLPEFIRSTEPYAQDPVLGDLAALERALNDAFDSPDAPAIGMPDLMGIAPEAWASLSFACSPSAACIDVSTNVAAIWSALKGGSKPPAAIVSKDPTRILVWRHAATAMFRVLEGEEAMAWEQLTLGKRFGDICHMLASYDDPPGAPARAAGHLKAWIDAGLLSAVTSEP